MMGFSDLYLATFAYICTTLQKGNHFFLPFMSVLASSEKATIKQEMKGIAKSNQTENNNVKNAAVAVQPQDPSVAPLDVVDEDITKASQEVAEISRLIGKPLTDSHALAMLKGILLEKIHAKLEDTKDISASSKSTEEGVNKFVAALAASKKKNDEQASTYLLLS